MAIDLTGTYGWFPRHGAFIGEFNRVAALYGSATDDGFQSIWSLFATSDQAAVQGLPDVVTSFRTTGGTYSGVLTADGQLASRLQAGREDAPLVPDDFPTSINSVRQRMIATNQTIARPAVAGSVAYDAGNDGDAKFFFSNTNIYGDPLDMTLAEDISLLCTSQGSGFASTFSMKGEPAVATSAWNWPQGSGLNSSVTLVDPAVDGIVTNSSLDTFTVANTPDDWTIIDGAAGTSVFEATSGGVRTGTNAVYLLATGANTTKIAQEVSLSINTVYAVTFQVKMNSNAAAGTLVVHLWDPDAGAVLTNDAGDDLEVSYGLNGGGGEVTTTYQLLTVFFSTPRQLPTTVQLRAGYGVAGTSTRELYVCNLQMFTPTAAYGVSGTGTYGPFVCGVANTLPSAVNDAATLTVTNDAPTRSFALGLERIYSMRSAGVYLPSSNSPTIANSIVTH